MSNDYVIVDSGANLANKKFQRDLDQVLDRALNAGVKKLVVLSSSEKSAREALRLTRLYPGTLFCAAGLHPLETQLWADDIKVAFNEILPKPECIGIGVCGLDLTKLEVASLKQQLSVLEAQLQMARDLSKPVVLFEKSGSTELLHLLRTYPGLSSVVIHGFAGSAQQAKEYLHKGYFLSMTGALWKAKEEMQQLLRDPAVQEQLLLASDAPFLFPNAKSKLRKSQEEDKESIFSELSESLVRRYCSFQRNEPCSLALTCELLAGILDLKPNDVALKTTYNALKAFKLQF
ncbi:uncharacterized protein LOC111269016 [Varroa jacobsoni]|uniref:Deoxyribonuclease TATDN1 n=1 Tax=Varroa destructor TaxID=109461 RepID=A0A7M7JFK5_VARDE|nr:uncharacterized protein LOC111246170 [Varroa destructor]XP_022704057.1 uncharacterized protein LOC111269016 [Varroa jacobsoni]